MKNLYAIRDLVAVSLGPIMVMYADAAAVRAFGDVAIDPLTSVGRHVGDFDLVCIGKVDDRGLVVVGDDMPRVVITGMQWKASQAPEEPKLALEA